jgi:tRNA pseudouridine32 synthase/23S rRNA pseudouridine746 synthase
LVCYQYGKVAKTQYKVIARTNNTTRIHFFPITGRTHQLRVHAAHPKGLNTPIVGDDLYGKVADRLYLHAAELMFVHPVSGDEVVVECEVGF